MFPSRAFSVPIGIGTGLYLFVLTRFLHANRYPLRLKTLQRPEFEGALTKQKGAHLAGQRARCADNGVSGSRALPSRRPQVLHGASLQCRPVSSTIPAGGKVATIHVGGQNRSPSRSPHGRTRMTVFPERRSVELKAATASSRVETLPMFVRSRPSRTRRTISLRWARSDSTTKSTAKPSQGLI